MQQGRLQIRSSLFAFASLDCSYTTIGPLPLQAETTHAPASAFTSVLSIGPRQGSGCARPAAARPAAALDPSAACATQITTTGLDLEGEVLAEMLGRHAMKHTTS
jgi:hypothetical protein